MCNSLIFIIFTPEVAFMLFNLFAMLFKASLKSDWNIKHATRSPKCGISLSSNRNCSGLSRGWSGWDATWFLIKLNSSSVAAYNNICIIICLILIFYTFNNFLHTYHFINLLKNFNADYRRVKIIKSWKENELIKTRYNWSVLYLLSTGIYHFQFLKNPNANSELIFLHFEIFSCLIIV